MSPSEVEALRERLFLLVFHWRKMAEREEDPAVRMARKFCAADLLYAIGADLSDGMRALAEARVTAAEEAADPHAHCPPFVEFDEKAAHGLSPGEIRRRWPRKTECPHCGLHGIFYASFAHYIMGDW